MSDYELTSVHYDLNGDPDGFCVPVQAHRDAIREAKAEGWNDGKNSPQWAANPYREP